jgi:hypothetical protein
MNPETAKKIWSDIPWYVKLLVPLIVVALFFRSSRDFLSTWIEQRRRTQSG